jgi:3-hydroxyisobutyrate dehydrogenase
MSERVGFIGLGLMGTPMVRRLLAAGHAVTVWNRSPDKMAPLLAAGAVAAPDRAAVAHGSDVLMLCVSDTAAVEHVMFGAGGASAGLRAESVVVDFSSIRPDATRRFAAHVGAQGAAWIDAPVSGGPTGAAAGTLAIMAGGHDDAIARVRPLMAALCSRFTHMGPSGAGQTTKLVNQVIVGACFATLAEAMRLAEAAGVDAARIPACLQGGFADSIPLQVFGPRMAARAWTPALGHTETMVKDMDTALELAAKLGAALPMATTAAALLHRLAIREGGEVEPSALVLGG